MPPTRRRETTSPAADDLAGALLELGFSQHEARAYVGLLGREPRTGYAVAKATGVPQPKVYEALRRLVARGAAFELSGHPARYIPVPVDQLLEKLEAGFAERVHKARQRAAELVADDDTPEYEPVRRLGDWARLEAAACATIARATRRVYISARADELTLLRGPIEEAVRRKVDVVALVFGKDSWPVEGVRTFMHASTDKILYRNHQARHLAIVVDSAETVWGLAPDGHSWAGVTTDSALIVAAIKDFIRHDIDFQRVYVDFADDLKGRYGPALEALEDYRQDPPPSPSVSARERRRQAAG